MTTLLSVENLSVGFKGHGGTVTALRNVSFKVATGKTLALVGESGSGKSVSSLAIMGLLASNARILGGNIRFSSRDGHDVDLLNAKPGLRRSLRGADMAMIFQEPMSSLNPLFTVGDQIGEMVLVHEGLDLAARRRRVIEMLELVEIPAASTRLDQYPHEMSGGMRQRVMIALALICRPRLLIADEPTTALDVTVQAQILDLMRRLQTEMGMSILFITHDLGVVAEIADNVAVMYAGSIVEAGDVGPLFDMAAHPYTRGLMASIPRPGRKPGTKLVPIPGVVPALSALPSGCAFAPRCGLADADCSAPVSLRNLDLGTQVACHHPQLREQAHV